MAGSAAVVVELSLWNVTYVRPVEAVVVSGDYMAFSGRRGDADRCFRLCTGKINLGHNIPNIITRSKNLKIKFKK